MTTINNNIIDLATARLRVERTSLLEHLHGPRERSCLCCSRPFLSTGPGSRVCVDCKVADAAASAT